MRVQLTFNSLHQKKKLLGRFLFSYNRFALQNGYMKMSPVQYRTQSQIS